MKHRNYDTAQTFNKKLNEQGQINNYLIRSGDTELASNNCFKKWTQKEEQELIRLVTEEKLTLSQLSRTMKRSRGAIIQRLDIIFERKTEQLKSIEQDILTFATQKKENKKAKKPRTLTKKQKVEKRSKNLRNGRPPKSHFPWSEKEQSYVKNMYAKRVSIYDIADRCQRSPKAIAAHLKNAGLMSVTEFSKY